MWVRCIVECFFVRQSLSGGRNLSLEGVNLSWRAFFLGGGGLEGLYLQINSGSQNSNSWLASMACLRGQCWLWPLTLSQCCSVALFTRCFFFFFLHCFVRIPLSVLSKFCPHPTDFIFVLQNSTPSSKPWRNVWKKDEWSLTADFMMVPFENMTILYPADPLCVLDKGSLFLILHLQNIKWNKFAFVSITKCSFSTHFDSLCC